MPAPPPRSNDARRVLSALLSRAVPEVLPFVDSSAAAAAAGFGRDRALLLPDAALFGGRSSTLSVWSVLPLLRPTASGSPAAPLEARCDPMRGTPCRPERAFVLYYWIQVHRLTHSVTLTGSVCSLRRLRAMLHALCKLE